MSKPDLDQIFGVDCEGLLLTGYQLLPGIAGDYLGLKLTFGPREIEIAIEHHALPRLITELAQAQEKMHARRTEPRN